MKKIALLVPILVAMPAMTIAQLTYTGFNGFKGQSYATATTGGRSSATSIPLGAGDMSLKSSGTLSGTAQVVTSPVQGFVAYMSDYNFRIGILPVNLSNVRLTSPGTITVSGGPVGASLSFHLIATVELYSFTDLNGDGLYQLIEPKTLVSIPLATDTAYQGASGAQFLFDLDRQNAQFSYGLAPFSNYFVRIKHTLTMSLDPSHTIPFSLTLSMPNWTEARIYKS